MDVQILGDVTQSFQNPARSCETSLRKGLKLGEEKESVEQSRKDSNLPRKTIYQQVLQIALMVSRNKALFLIQEKEGLVGARDEELQYRSNGFTLKLGKLTHEKMASIIRSCLLRGHSNYRFCHTLASRVSLLAFESSFSLNKQGDREGISYSKYILRTEGDTPIRFSTTIKNLRILPARRLDPDDGFTEVVRQKGSGPFQVEWKLTDPLVCGKFSFERAQYEIKRGVTVSVSKVSPKENVQICEAAGRNIISGKGEREAFGVGLYAVVAELIARGFSKCQTIPLWQETSEQNELEVPSVVLLVNRPEDGHELPLTEIKKLCWERFTETLYMTTGDGLIPKLECDIEVRFDDFGDYIAVVFHRKSTSTALKQEYVK